jgi:hypothetical protein
MRNEVKIIKIKYSSSSVSSQPNPHTSAKRFLHGCPTSLSQHKFLCSPCSPNAIFTPKGCGGTRQASQDFAPQIRTHLREIAPPLINEWRGCLIERTKKVVLSVRSIRLVTSRPSANPLTGPPLIKGVKTIESNSLLIVEINFLRFGSSRPERG